MIVAKNRLNDKKKTLNSTEAKQMFVDTIKTISTFFSRESVEEIAWQTGFIKRASSQISGFDFLKTLLLASLDPEHTSLEKMSDILTYVNHNTRVRAQSLMERINTNESVNFLSSIQEMIFAKRLSSLIPELPANLFESFSKVLIQDSSTMVLHEKLQKHFKGSGGRASKACAKLDVTYDLKAKRFEKITLTDQGEADQRLALKIEDILVENALIIRDLGYLRVDGLIQIIAKKAFFISRLKSQIDVYLNIEDKNPIDIAEYLDRKFKNFNVVDLQVFITSQKLPVRLVAYKAPDEVVNKRRREAKVTAKKQGRTLREKTLKHMDFTIFITNVPMKIWKPEIIGTIYRIRWQIELLFKSWKSGMKINYLKGINPERIKALIYARLILMIVINEIYRLVDRIGSGYLERSVSMHKVFMWMKDGQRLLRFIIGCIEWWETRFCVDMIFKSMCQQTRKESVNRTV